MVAMLETRWADALESYGEGVAIASALGTTWQLGTSHLNFGTALLHSGRIEEAVASVESALGVYRELGDDVFAARTVNVLAQAALAGNQIDRADGLAREALTSVAALGERQGMVEGLLNLAAVAAARSEIERAATLAGAAAAIRETIAARAADFDVAIAGRLLDQAQAGDGEMRWRRGWERGRALDPAAAIALALAP
jgi:tetratricopeptide (TPR) repeat protein